MAASGCMPGLVVVQNAHDELPFCCRMQQSLVHSKQFHAFSAATLSQHLHWLSAFCALKCYCKCMIYTALQMILAAADTANASEHMWPALYVHAHIMVSGMYRVQQRSTTLQKPNSSCIHIHIYRLVDCSLHSASMSQHFVLQVQIKDSGHGLYSHV